MDETALIETPGLQALSHEKKDKPLRPWRVAGWAMGCYFQLAAAVVPVVRCIA